MDTRHLTSPDASSLGKCGSLCHLEDCFLSSARAYQAKGSRAVWLGTAQVPWQRACAAQRPHRQALGIFLLITHFHFTVEPNLGLQSIQQGKPFSWVSPYTHKYKHANFNLWFVPLLQDVDWVKSIRLDLTCHVGCIPCKMQGGKRKMGRPQTLSLLGLVPLSSP